MTLASQKKALLNQLHLNLDWADLEYWQERVDRRWLIGGGAQITLDQNQIFTVPKGVSELIREAAKRLHEFPDEAVADFANALEAIRARLGSSLPRFGTRHADTEKLYQTPITAPTTPVSAPEIVVIPNFSTFLESTYPDKSLSSTDFKVKKEIGNRSAYGQVFLAIHTASGVQVALKTVTKKTPEKNRELFQREATILDKIAKANSGYIVTFYGTFGEQTPGATPTMIFGYMEGGSVLSFLRVNSPTFDKRARWADDIARGVQCLHALNILHRDLKPENLLLDAANERVKIADFGGACTTDSEKINTFFGSYQYAAPELFYREPAGKDSDIYNLVMLFLVLITGLKLPEPRNNEVPLFDLPNKKDYLKNGDLGGYKEWPPAIAFIEEIIQSGWDKERANRPTIEQIVATFDENMPKAPPPPLSPALVPS